MSKNSFLITVLLGLLLIGGAGYGFYSYKMNAVSFKGIGLQIPKGVPDEMAKKWVEKFEEVFSEDAFLQEVVDETGYAEKLDVPSGEAVAHLKEATIARFVKRKGTIEVGLKGKRKQNDALNEISKVLHEKASKLVSQREKSYAQYLEAAAKAREKMNKEASE